MALSSMTGFAREAGCTGEFQWVWELKSVNGRGLDIRTRTPQGFDAAADEIRTFIQKSIFRGQCQLSLSITKADTTPKAKVNEAILNSLLELIEKLPVSEKIEKASLDGLLAIRGVVELEEGGDPSQDPAVFQAVKNARVPLIKALKKAREQEGKALKAVLLKQMASLDHLVGQAEAHPARQPDAIKEKLANQIAQLLDIGSNALDGDRLHQEAILIATRVDIREELDRLKAHIEAAHSLLEEEGAVGRRLDFLAQEFGREANTLCTKANDVALSRIGLEIKALVDQFKEQVQNVE